MMPGDRVTLRFLNGTEGCIQERIIFYFNDGRGTLPQWKNRVNWGGGLFSDNLDSELEKLPDIYLVMNKK